MSRGISLRTLLLFTLGLQMAFMAVAIGLLGTGFRQRAATELAARSQQRAGREVRDYLIGYLRTPQRVIRLMAEAVASGQLDPGDRPAVIRSLWMLQRTFPEASYLNYGWTSGDFIGLGRVDNSSDRPFLEIADAGTVQRLELIRLDGSGRPAGLERIKPFEDFRRESWYALPLQADRPVWTPIYNWVDAPEVMAMGAGMPVRRDGVVVGVAGVDVFLTSIGRFLTSLPIARTGAIYIVEADGRLVADTSGRLPFRVINGRGERLRAQDAADPLIRASARALLRQQPTGVRLEQARQLRLPMADGEALVRVEPYRDSEGLDWRIVLVIPEAEVYGNLRQEVLTLMGVAMLAILIAGAITLLVLEALIRRLDRLVTSTNAMAQGDLSQTVELGSIREMARLAASFNAMAGQLRRSFATLRLRNREIARLVKQRSDQLSQREQELNEEIVQRRRLERTLAAGREARREGLADPETGLFNRRGLERRLERVLLREGGEAGPLVLVVIAIGAAAGQDPLAQALLERAASWLEQHSTGPEGLAAHLGDGRFALVLPDSTPAAVPALLHSLEEALGPLRIRAGIAAVAAGSAAENGEALLQRAEQALAGALAGEPAEAARPAADQPRDHGDLHWRIAP